MRSPSRSAAQAPACRRPAVRAAPALALSRRSLSRGGDHRLSSACACEQASMRIVARDSNLRHPQHHRGFVLRRREISCAEAAIAQARKLAADGADVLDIGAAPSNPDAKPVAPEDRDRAASARRRRTAIGTDLRSPSTASRLRSSAGRSPSRSIISTTSKGFPIPSSIPSSPRRMPS